MFILLESIELMGKNSKMNLHCLSHFVEIAPKHEEQNKSNKTIPSSHAKLNKCENRVIPRYSSVISFYIIAKQTTISVSIFQTNKHKKKSNFSAASVSLPSESKIVIKISF